ncbi:recombination-associated protein RdgC [Pontiella agarivorans]|uniref:Recombination-associated protein RdgC n=1 Tax=Pontiella agarivorans TaxID=3038953 RepID=A0ABU5MV21_9BACT|nr:recombination-associated protein RdgC [Pontiella agarivorans]MDZ8118055.1 recombination-associated protein RdgC [Pontiella agarivorans]
MGFEKGSISFRMYFASRDLTTEDIDKFAAAALPPLSTLAEEEVHGWVGGRHLLDRNITEENAFLGGYLRLSLTQARKKVPTSLLQAECALEEMAVMEAEDKNYLNQTQRSEIKKSIQERLLPEMPVQLKGIDFVFDERSHMIYSTATSEKQVDAFVLTLMQTTGCGATPADPETIGERVAQVDVQGWAPSSFSDELEDGMVDGTAGREFLMWLWFCSEKRQGIAQIPDVGEMAYMVEGPLTFVMEGKGAHEITLRKGEPMLSAEARTALLSGKKLKKAKMQFVRGEEVWAFTFDADDFVFRSLKLPETETFDRVGKFQERMVFLETFRQSFFHLYSEFAKERNDSKQWKETKEEMRKWVADRPTTV